MIWVYFYGNKYQIADNLRTYKEGNPSALLWKWNKTSNSRWPPHVAFLASYNQLIVNCSVQSEITLTSILLTSKGLFAVFSPLLAGSLYFQPVRDYLKI